MKPVSLAQHLRSRKIDEQSLPESLVQLILSVTEAACQIAEAVRISPIAGTQGEAGSINCQDETQKKLDVIANDLLLEKIPACGCVAGIASEENEDVILLDTDRNEYLFFMDPLDGSSNVDVNVTVGTIFSIYRRANPDTPATPEDFLVSGNQQIAAGYIAYGSATQLALTVGDGVSFYTWSPRQSEFVLSQEKVTLLPETKEFAVNMARYRFWYPAFRQYVDDLVAGQEGPRGKDFNMRWVASMVADVHRILCRGGIFMYPADQKVAGRLRLMYEANPMAMLIEQAGGKATDGRQSILSIMPTHIHQRVGVVLGSATEVMQVAHYMEKTA